MLVVVLLLLQFGSLLKVFDIFVGAVIWVVRDVCGMLCRYKTSPSWLSFAASKRDTFVGCWNQIDRNNHNFFKVQRSGASPNSPLRHALGSSDQALRGRFPWPATSSSSAGDNYDNWVGNLCVSLYRRIRWGYITSQSRYSTWSLRVAGIGTR